MGKLTDALLAFDDASIQRLNLFVASAPFFNRGDYRLQLTVFNSAAGVTLGVRYRAIDIEQNPVSSGDFITPATNRTASTLTIQLPIGWIYGVTVFATAGTPLTGNTFCVLDVVRGDGTAAFVVQNLAEGYVSAQVRLSWPQGPFSAPQDGQGVLRSITGTTPGAGAEISETVPSNARWEVLAFRFQLLTAVAVANRVNTLLLDDGANEYHRIETPIVQAASTTFIYVHSQGHAAGSAGAGNAIHKHLPGNIRLGAGHRIRTSTGAIQAADQYSAVQYLVREWLDI